MPGPVVFRRAGHERFQVGPETGNSSPTDTLLRNAGVMSTHREEVLPGFVLDDDLFTAASDGIQRYAPEIELTWDRFVDPQQWSLIPDECGGVVKAEMVLSSSIEATRKINRWFAPDLRGGAAPAPHSHPWAFTSWILAGGYSEDRYELAGDVVRRDLGVSHAVASANTVPKELFHEVTEIHDPERTLTLMVCGRGQRGSWGYLDVDRRELYRKPVDPGFSARWRAANPHLA